ncbi:MAG: hypothetical protein V4654_07095 [Bdellovibrionota bacterium]
MINQITDYLHARTSDNNSPFALACKGRDAIKYPLRTGVGSMGMAALDSEGNKASDFFVDFLSEIEIYGNENIRITKLIEACLTNKINDPDCAVVLEWSNIDLPKYVDRARYHLALSADTNAATGAELYFLNTKLKPIRSYKFIPWDPLTKEEIEFSNKDLAYINRRARELTQLQLPKAGVLDRMVLTDKKIRDVRVRHLLKYRKMIGEVPLINYLTSAKPNHREIINAAVSTRIYAEKEIEKIKALKREVIDNPYNLKGQLLYTINYTVQLEELLKKKPEYCALGAYYYKTKGNIETSNVIITAVPMLAACFLAPPLGVALGAAVGAGYIIDSQYELKETEQRMLGRFNGSGAADNNELRQAQDARDFQLFIAPLAIATGGSLSKTRHILSKLK